MNEIMIVLITATVSVLTILYFKDTGKNRIKTADLEENRYAIEAILAFIREAFNNILKTNLYELNITREEFEKRMHNRNRLRRALKNCTYGDINAKNYVKDFIKDILVRSYEIDENNVNNIISLIIQESCQHRISLKFFFIITRKNMATEPRKTNTGI